MTTKRGTFSKRLCLLFFALLLALLVGAVPVFAQSLAEEEATSFGPPSAQQVAEGLEAAEREEAARQRELESPEAVRQREASATAYAGLTQAEAQQLLFESFPEELATLEADPARSLDELHLVHVLSESVATVRDAEGEGSLLEASIPLRVENDKGQLEKVKLDLTEGEGGFEPENPITELSIPLAADEPISVGEEGLAVSAPQADPSQGQSLHGTDVGFFEVATDTDMMVSPIGAGVEIFDQLRSVESPEALHFHFDLPARATLSASATGGAEVTREGQPIAIVPPPSAVDAQGTNVPVAVEVEGDTLTLRVRHQEGEYAMPILVDPTVAPIKENYEGTWSSGSNLDALETAGVWTPSGNDESQTYIRRGTHCLNSSLCPASGRGLFISSMNKNIPVNTYTQWVYTVPGTTTFIPSIYPEPSAVFNPFSRTNNACSYSSYPQPHDYDGAFDASGNWTWLSTNRAQWYGNDTLFTKAKGLAFGLSSGSSSVNIPCWRDIMVGGVMVRLDDPESPTLNSVTGFPTGWIGEGAKFTITANLSDPGLGVQNAQVYPAGAAEVPYVSTGSQCPGTKTHPCPASLAAPIALAAGNFDEGENNVQVSGWDPTGKVSGTYTTTMRVDRQAPQISLSGQLMTAIEKTEGELSFPTYNLQIKAEDGSLANAESKRSGVKSIEVFLGKQTTPLQTWTQECPGSSCSLEETFQLKLTELEPGENTLRVVAKDQLNQSREQEIKFEYVPAMGMKEEYVLQHFPLPDGKDHSGEESSEAPELAVNVMNGNLVYRESAVDVEGPSVDLKVDPVYNSELPTAQNTEWGDGWSLAQTPHFKRLTTIKGRVTDPSGQREGDVVLPPETGETRFTSALKSTTTKEPSNAYTLTDESGETGNSLIFDASGRTAELQTPGPAKVHYSYEAGALSEIAVEDPTISSDPGPRLAAIEGAPEVAPSFESAFGTAGSGNGQLSHPADVAVDPGGNLWVVDRANNRIERFNAQGEFVSKFGSAGSENGQLSQASAIAIDSAGNLWVLDGGNRRVQKFKPSGEYLGKFSLPEGGFLANPTGIALDAKGDAWVAQRFEGRVREFNPAGEFVKLLAPHGSGEGQIGEAADVAIGPGGRIWVADYANNRIEAFTEEGQFIRQFGSAGSGNGQLSGPLAINVDSRGNVWVADRGNSRIEQFTEDGKFLAKFGTAGSGEGQLALSAPGGMTSDSEGHLWVTDTDNNRVQRWALPWVAHYYHSFESAFGTAGSGNGQLSHPADVAVDPEGNLWVVDRANNRVEKFNAQGEFVSKFGTSGSENGQLSRPSGIAIDPEGNLWVLDGSNRRVEKFKPSGEYLGQFSLPEGGILAELTGIALDAKGDAWVAQRSEGRVREFNPAGEFIKLLAPHGSGEGQIGEAADVAIGPGGRIWVADYANNRIEAFNEEGQFIRQFGTTGSGNGQLNTPLAIDVDNQGNVWVLDKENSRIDEFTEGGKFLAKFGAAGSGEGQLALSGPAGLASDNEGHLWVTDTDNNRLQRWGAFSYASLEEKVLPPEEPNDPTVAVNVASGLVSSVKGEEAGTTSFSYSGDDRVSSSGPAGETTFKYDSAGRMTEVKLPNGTVGSIAYDSASRVTSLTVDPAGSEPAKTTYFYYRSEPRQTTVTPEVGTPITYAFSEDGSVFKWWNVAKAPEISLAGTIWVNAEKELATGTNNLEVQADSPEGIASIQVIAGETVVEEKVCNQNYETEEIECKHEVLEWVVETASLPPGTMQVEINVKDRLGNFATKRFWVSVPYTPPPNPEEPTKPSFFEIKRFRERFGLDRDLNPATEQQQINNRIYDLLAAWSNPQTPEGEVARSSAEKWGVPLRTVDVAEMEYREWYTAIDGRLIDEWGYSHYPNTYAGYWIDNAAGGIIRIGFTQEQAARITDFIQQEKPAAPESLAAFAAPPTQARTALEAIEMEVASLWEADPQLLSSITELGVSDSADSVRIGSSNVSGTEQRLTELLGSLAGISVVSQPEFPEPQLARDRENGRMLAGDRIMNDWTPGQNTPTWSWGTAGFGAIENTWIPQEKRWDHTRFLLAAGHMGEIGNKMYRFSTSDLAGLKTFSELPRSAGTKIGWVARNPFSTGSRRIDALAVQFNSDGLSPTRIFGNGRFPPIGPAGVGYRGEKLCTSGARTEKVKCGEVVGMKKIPFRDATHEGLMHGVLVVDGLATRKGDSGGPVWDPQTHRAIGINSEGHYHGEVSYVQPLLNTPTGRETELIGALNASKMGDLHIIEGSGS